MSKSVINRAYRLVRRYRYGFHNPKGKAVVELKTQYQAEFDKKQKQVGTGPTRFKKYIKSIKAENAKKMAPFLAYKTKLSLPKTLPKYHKGDIKKLGNQQAHKRYSYLESMKILQEPVSRPTDLKDEEITKTQFAAEYDILASVERFIRHKLNELGDTWLYGDGSLSPNEQYERKVLLFSLGRAGKAGDNKKKALRAARKFFLEILEHQPQLEKLYAYKKVPASAAHAQANTRLAKLIVGERVRFPNSSPDNDGEIHLSNDSVVNKLATLLNYLEAEGIDVEQVADFIEENGGYEKTIAKART